MLSYACRLCPDMAFKWQSALYKHCLITHFSDQIRRLLPSEAPFKCPKCDYVAKQRYYILFFHLVKR